MNGPGVKTAFYFTALWLILVGSSLYFRPLMPVDETRCLSVAWEMYQSGNYLLPHLNGELYTQKSPLLFWLIILGWKIFGVNEWWPRLLPPLFGLGSLFLTASLSRALWPDDHEASSAAPIILLGTVLWMLFTTVVLYEVVMIFFLLLSFLFLLKVWKQGGILPWLLAGLSLGLAILAKGAVALIPAAPVMLFLPWCMPATGRMSYIRWYVGIAAAGFAGLVIGFSWLAGAALSEGAGFAQTVLYNQYFGRVVSSFVHRRPWWWYLPRIPLVLFPWSIYLRLWRKGHRLSISDGGVRFCLVWIIPALCALSLISGKQIYYLLFLFPAFALLCARVVSHTPARRCDIAPIAAVIAFVGIGLLAAPHLAGRFGIPMSFRQIGWTGGIIVSAAAFLLPFAVGKGKRSIVAITVTIVVVFVVAHAGVFTVLRPTCEMKPAAGFLKSLEEKGYPLAHAGKYNGEYHFLGRLSKPIEVVADKKKVVSAWLATHPNGRVVLHFSDLREIEKAGYVIEYVQPYIGKYVAVIRSSA